MRQPRSLRFSQHRGNSELTVFCGRRLTENLVAIETRNHLIGPKNVRQRKGVRHGRNPVEIERLERRSMFEYGVELLGEEVQFGLIDIESGESGDVADIGSGNEVTHDR